jgi:hypothetical protein
MSSLCFSYVSVYFTLFGTLRLRSSQGCSLIRMLANWLGILSTAGSSSVDLRCVVFSAGPDVFGKGLRNYLAKFAFKNAESTDLWFVPVKNLPDHTRNRNAMAEASGLPVTELMNNWTRQIGFPIVDVTGERLSIASCSHAPI